MADYTHLAMLETSVSTSTATASATPDAAQNATREKHLCIQTQQPVRRSRQWIGVWNRHHRQGRDGSENLTGRT